jgi:hypothetical protein
MTNFQITSVSWTRWHLSLIPVSPTQKQLEGFCISIPSGVEKLLAWWALQKPMYICLPNDKRPAIQRISSADPSAQTASKLSRTSSQMSAQGRDKGIPKDPMRLSMFAKPANERRTRSPQSLSICQGPWLPPGAVSGRDQATDKTRQPHWTWQFLEQPPSQPQPTNRETYAQNDMSNGEAQIRGSVIHRPRRSRASTSDYL